MRVFRIGCSAAAGLFLVMTPLHTQTPPPEPIWWDAPGTEILSQETPNDFAPVNLGQLKHVAAMARIHLENELWGGAGAAIDGMVDAFAVVSPDNLTPVNLGQLKAVAKPFYDRLILHGYDTTNNLVDRGYDPSWEEPYPWGPAQSSTNYAPANIGQLKMVFSFDLTGLPHLDTTTQARINDFVSDGATITGQQAGLMTQWIKAAKDAGVYSDIIFLGSVSTAYKQQPESAQVLTKIYDLGPQANHIEKIAPEGLFQVMEAGPGDLGLPAGPRKYLQVGAITSGAGLTRIGLSVQQPYWIFIISRNDAEAGSANNTFFRGGSSEPRMGYAGSDQGGDKFRFSAGQWLSSSSSILDYTNQFALSAVRANGAETEIWEFDVLRNSGDASTGPITELLYPYHGNTSLDVLMITKDLTPSQRADITAALLSRPPVEEELPPNFQSQGPIGWASTNGGVTGGGSGEVRKYGAHNLDQFILDLEAKKPDDPNADLPLVMQLDGTLDFRQKPAGDPAWWNDNGRYQVGSNKTIIVLGCEA